MEKELRHTRTDDQSDKVRDWVDENEMDLLEEYLEDNKNWQAFTGWLYSKEQDEVRKSLFSEFLCCRKKDSEVSDFHEWATKQGYDRLYGN